MIMRIILKILFLLLFVIPVFLFAQEQDPPPAPIPNEDCFSCHSDATLTKQDQHGKQISLFVDESKFRGSVHGDGDCISCHSDITEVPHPEKLKKVDCAVCHEDSMQEFLQSSHGVAYTKKTPDAPDCATCHTKHEIRRKTDPASKTHPLNQIGLCSSCHLDKDFQKRHPGITATNLEKFHDSVHGRGVLRSGLKVSATCVSCHTAHSVKDKADPAALIHWKNIPKTCGTCHEGIFEDFSRSEHGKAWAKNRAEGPNCTTCHTPHNIGEPLSAEFQLTSPNTCSKCHEKEAPSYRDTFHGQAKSLGFVRAASCADCHTPHLNLKASDPASSVHPANLQKTCGSCHADEANANFISFDPHADPRQKDKNPWLFYIYSAMVLLLTSVFTFFGIHTFLWLQRAVVGFFRGEFAEEKNAGVEGPWVIRFNGITRAVHLMIMASFLGLAFTGLPIRFHFVPWTQSLVKLLGGLEVFRFFHRFFAIVTFGYALFHLSDLIYRIVMKKQRRLLAGPSSMVPRLKDFTDLFGMLRWFLYLGPKPRFDRWTYWEKFDYFAVFWGIPVIGISGLMLWFPGFFTNFVPGWVLNIVQIVHSEEALLAVGFIFIFHFFHTHLRPEAFPMDTVIFTGRIPLEKFKHERPEEFRRMTEDGTLQNIITDPPSREMRIGAYIVGTLGLTTGVILAILILYSVFLYR